MTAVRSLAWAAAAGGWVLGGAASPAASVPNHNPNDPTTAPTVAAQVAHAPAPVRWPALLESTPAPRMSTDAEPVGFYEVVEDLLGPAWITFELAHEPFGNGEDGSAATATEPPARAEAYRLLTTATRAPASVPFPQATGRSPVLLNDPVARSIALPPGAVTGTVGLLLLFGRTLFRRSLQALR